MLTRFLGPQDLNSLLIVVLVSLIGVLQQHAANSHRYVAGYGSLITGMRPGTSGGNWSPFTISRLPVFWLGLMTLMASLFLFRGIAAQKVYTWEEVGLCFGICLLIDMGILAFFSTKMLYNLSVLLGLYLLVDFLSPADQMADHIVRIILFSLMLFWVASYFYYVRHRKKPGND